MEKDRKTCFNAEKNDFDQQMACRVPVCWSKYTKMNDDTQNGVSVGNHLECRLAIVLALGNKALNNLFLPHSIFMYNYAFFIAGCSKKLKKEEKARNLELLLLTSNQNH